MKRYPATAVVFEVKSRRGSGSSLRIGTRVEGAGPCCFGTDRAWKCGVLVLNGMSNEEDEYLWARNLRPLTRAAREMLALCESRR
jgi:hypothetical protein